MFPDSFHTSNGYSDPTIGETNGGVIVERLEMIATTAFPGTELGLSNERIAAAEARLLPASRRIQGMRFTFLVMLWWRRSAAMTIAFTRHWMAALRSARPPLRVAAGDRPKDGVFRRHAVDFSVKS